MRRFFLAMALGATMLFGSTSKAGDIIDLDLTLVDPSARDLMLEAEKFWEDRIAGYSSELPVRIRRQLTALQLTATVAPIDGEGNILGFAGPDVTASISSVGVGNRSFEVALSASMTFDLDDFPSMEADGILFDVIVHEMGHALGIGSLWATNSVLEALPEDADDAQLPNYIGRYGLAQYQLETGQFAVSTVPVEQDGGGGTAGAHWDDAGFFNTLGQFNARKEIMTGFACDVLPSGELICLPKFLSQASLGSLADIGFAVNGINEQFALPRSNIQRPPWDKGQLGPTVLAGGVALNFDGPKISLRSYQGANGSGTGQNQGDPNAADPYNLRNKSWAK